MYIIDKNKDYYDHYSYIYGVDKTVVFNRKDSIVLNDAILVDMSYLYNLRANYKEAVGFLLLEIGTMQYLIKVDKIVLKKIREFINTGYVFISCRMQIIREFKDNKHYYKTPISIRGVEINDNRSWYQRRKSENLIYKNEGLTCKDVINRIIREPIELPILADTQITSLLDGDIVWKELQNYVSSLNNDIDVSLPTTDVNKAINHGFDKKTSFRHPIK